MTAGLIHFPPTPNSYKLSYGDLVGRIIMHVIILTILTRPTLHSYSAVLAAFHLPFASLVITASLRSSSDVIYGRPLMRTYAVSKIVVNRPANRVYNLLK